MTGEAAARPARVRPLKLECSRGIKREREIGERSLYEEHVTHTSRKDISESNRQIK